MVGGSSRMKESIPKVASVALIAVVMLTLLCTGCGLYINDDSIAQKDCEQILEFLDTKDSKSLKSMFCKEILSSPQNLDAQIQTAMNFFQGKTISHGSFKNAGGGEAWEHWQISRLDISPYIKNIVTDANKKYEIHASAYIVYKADKNKEGISDIVITASDGQKCEIGKYIK
jgi:hypothetical protein